MEIDGNDMYAVCAALESLPPSDPLSRRKPIFIISNTVKGKGVDFMENNPNWHGGGIAKDELERALLSVEKNRRVR